MKTVSASSCQSQARQRTYGQAPKKVPKKAPKKILIVDDESLIRYSLQRFVEEEGFAALTADSGIHALRSLEEDKPDIVILDIHLPDANGLALLKTIKEAGAVLSFSFPKGLSCACPACCPSGWVPLKLLSTLISRLSLLQ